MNNIFADDSWADYLYWQTQDKKTLKRINALLQDIERNGQAPPGRKGRIFKGKNNFAPLRGEGCFGLAFPPT